MSRRGCRFVPGKVGAFFRDAIVGDPGTDLAWVRGPEMFLWNTLGREADEVVWVFTEKVTPALPMMEEVLAILNTIPGR